MRQATGSGSDFAKDVRLGLSAPRKFLQPKYFYNSKGDRLFQEIMQLDEYYLTRCEHEILERSGEQILSVFSPGGESFQLIEFGAGDGVKTKLLVDCFLRRGADFVYEPIDISENALRVLSDDMKRSFPSLKVNPLHADYFDALAELNRRDSRRKAVLFLGSSLGNLTYKESICFLRKLARHLNKGDALLLGLDLKKDPDVILKAYNDRQGVTRSFNLNLLERINEELHANFNLDRFMHYPVYEASSSEARSYLISTVRQEVHIAGIGMHVVFEPWESIHTEISRKYDFASIQGMAAAAGFKVTGNFYDSRGYFADTLWEVGTL